MESGKMKVIDGKINFRCKMNGCKHSCCGPFAGISTELDNIDSRPFDEIVLTQEDYKIFLDNGYERFIEEGYSPFTGKKYYKMALEEDGTCKAWKDGKCSIHESNPTLCKAFPFYFDLFSGLCAVECEGFSDDCWVEIDKISDSLEAAKKMYRFWIDFYSE